MILIGELHQTYSNYIYFITIIFSKASIPANQCPVLTYIVVLKF